MYVSSESSVETELSLFADEISTTISGTGSNDKFHELKLRVPTEIHKHNSMIFP